MQLMANISDKQRKIIHFLLNSSKICLGLLLAGISIWNANRCIDPESASLFNNFPYMAVLFFVAFDIAIIFVLLVLIKKLWYGIQRYKYFSLRNSSDIFLWAALIHFFGTLILQTVGRFTLTDYKSALLSSHAQYACEALPISIYVAYRILLSH